LGGVKNGFCPILIIGGMCPGCPPESTPMLQAVVAKPMIRMAQVGYHHLQLRCGSDSTRIQS